MQINNQMNKKSKKKYQRYKNQKKRISNETLNLNNDIFR